MFEIGNTLREARLRRSLDIADCEQATKIRAKYLRALEEEQFDVLPAPTYVKGFLRTYAEYLGLDGRLVLDEYESRFEGAGEGPGDFDQAQRTRRRQSSRAGRQHRSETRLLAVAIAIVLVGGLAIWAGFAGDDDHPAPAPAPTAALTAVFTARGGTAAYVEVRERGAAGRRLFANTIASGRSRRFASNQRLWVHVGDGANLRLVVNGHRVGTPAGRREFVITTKGHVERSIGG
ncbi:MAG TPA: RodZ domain-containing protein [Miltoncostaeaceae bacterium]|nr:RodZ domain-containing protein [Miltoncostaeaceae bacterium]